MIKIIESKSEGIVDGKNCIRAGLMVDTAAELTVEGFNNYRFTMGSIAYVIDTGKVYVLNSSGTWTEEGGSDS